MDELLLTHDGFWPGRWRAGPLVVETCRTEQPRWIVLKSSRRRLGHARRKSKGKKGCDAEQGLQIIT